MPWGPFPDFPGSGSPLSPTKSPPSYIGCRGGVATARFAMVVDSSLLLGHSKAPRTAGDASGRIDDIAGFLSFVCDFSIDV